MFFFPAPPKKIKTAQIFSWKFDFMILFSIQYIEIH